MQRLGRYGELTVIHLELVDGIGTPVVGSPCVFGHQATELHMVGFADELLCRRHYNLGDLGN